MEENTGTQHTAGRAQVCVGRDEMNFAEFPLAAISDFVPEGQKTLVFEDTTRDQGKPITRRLTISASDAYGLPTALDDEVILGLITLTKLIHFASRKVPFTRYQLIQLLGWRDDGRSYERLEQSLKRWLGVTLYYDNAWRDNQSQSWVSQNFHILEQVTLFDAAPRRKKSSGQDEVIGSYFVWNEVVFRSFESGYLKKIDLDLYRKLRSAIAKRMYRYLDKHFWQRGRWEFDLFQFAYGHIGLSRVYDTAQLKRLLDRAIAELEAVGFLEPMPASARYIKVSRGNWRIVFVRKESDTNESADALGISSGVEQMLIDRGVTPSVASELVQQFASEQITDQIGVFDWLRDRNDPKVSRNPAGYLVRAITKCFTPPRAFRAAKKRGARPTGAKTCDVVREKPSVVEQEENPTARAAIEQYWTGLSAADQQRLEEAALAQADRVMAQGLERARRENPARSEIYRRMIRDKHISRLLGLDESLRKLA